MFKIEKNPFFAAEDDLGGSGEKKDEEEKKEETLDEGEKKDVEDDKTDWKNAFLTSKSELKRVKAQLRALEEKNLDSDYKEKMSAIRTKAKEKGYDDDFADMFADTFGELLKSTPRKDSIDEEVSEELEDLVDEYPEIKKHKKDIADTLRKFRKVDPDFSVEHAIKLINPKKRDISELKLEIEQRNALSRKNEESSSPKGTGGGTKESYPLSDDEKRILKRLQEERPDKNWTAEKYYKLMKKKE